MTVPAAPPAAKAPADGNAPLYYRMREPAEKLSARLVALSRLDAAMRRRRGIELVASLAVTVALAALLWGGGAPSWAEELGTPATMLSFLAVGWVLAAAFCLRVRRAFRNFATEGPKVFVAGFFIFFASFFVIPLLTDVYGAELAAGWAALRERPSLFSAPREGLYLLAVSTGWALVIAWWYRLSRIRLCSPQPFETYFLTHTLIPLLRELPPDSICQATFNPFAAPWSARFQPVPLRGRGARGKPVIVDVVLHARFDLGAGRRLSLSVAHGRKQKGQRKFKGWKHKIRVRCHWQDPALAKGERKSPGTLDASYRALVDAGVKQVTENRHRFLLETPPGPVVDWSGDTLSVDIKLAPPVTMTSDLHAGQLPHPAVLLHTVRFLAETAGSLLDESLQKR